MENSLWFSSARRLEENYLLFSNWKIVNRSVENNLKLGSWKIIWMEWAIHKIKHYSFFLKRAKKQNKTRTNKQTSYYSGTKIGSGLNRVGWVQVLWPPHLPTYSLHRAPFPMPPLQYQVIWSASLQPANIDNTLHQNILLPWPRQARSVLGVT